jgi:hypothetical protein
VKKCQSCRGLVSPALREVQTPGVLTTSKHNLATFQHLTPSLAIAVHPFPLRARTGRDTGTMRRDRDEDSAEAVIAASAPGLAPPS